MPRTCRTCIEGTVGRAALSSDSIIWPTFWSSDSVAETTSVFESSSTPIDSSPLNFTGDGGASLSPFAESS